MKTISILCGAAAAFMMTASASNQTEISNTSFDEVILTRRSVRDSDGLRKILDIPDNEEVMAVISLGYRASEPATPAHKNIDDILRFY